MPYDITMCPGKDCPIKNDCYRFTAEIVWRQDFFGATPYDFKANSCKHFWNNHPSKEEQVRKLAYQIWQREGCPNGRSWEHWMQAEKEFKEQTKNL